MISKLGYKTNCNVEQDLYLLTISAVEELKLVSKIYICKSNKDIMVEPTYV